MGKNIIKHISLDNLNRLLFFFKYFFAYEHLKIGSHIRKPLKITGKRYISIGNSFVDKNARIEAISIYANEVFHPKIIIEDNVSIQQNIHLTCANEIIISRGTSITANVGIFDIIHPYENIKINPRIQSIKTKPIFIGENCLIGMNSVILPGTYLGRHCIVGALSVCSGNYPEYSVITGSPAKIIKRYNFNSNRWEKTNSDGSFKIN